MGHSSLTGAVLVEEPEDLPDVLLRVRLTNLGGHDLEELRELNLAAGIGIHVPDHLLQLVVLDLEVFSAERERCAAVARA